MFGLEEEKTRGLLDRLHADAAAHDAGHIERVSQQLGLSRNRTSDDYKSFYGLLGEAYLPVSKAFGKALYLMVRYGRPQNIVEFGTSLGISAIYLAAGLRDNGGGRLITAEFEAGKVARAKANLVEAGLAELVEFRIGDALDTLSSDMPTIDMVLLDGAKNLYLPLLHLLEPQLRPGALIAADNTDMDGLQDYLAYVHDAANHYATVDLATSKGNTLSVRTA